MSMTRYPSYRRASGPEPPQPSNGARPAAATTTAPVKLRKPVFTTVDQLLPQTHGHNLVARVLSARTVLDKPLPNRALPRAHVAECLVGDHTGTVLVTPRNQQIEIMKPGNTVIFRNAKIDMFKGTMRLAVDKWGLIEVVEEPAGFEVNEDNNISKVEYELVDVLLEKREKVSVPPEKREKVSVPPEKREKVSVPPEKREKVSVPPEKREKEKREKMNVPPEEHY